MPYFFNLNKKTRIFLFLVIIGLVSFNISRTIIASLEDSKLYLAGLSFETLLMSALFYLLFFYLRALSWNFLVKSLTSGQKLLENLPTWFLSELTRYIPGKVWPFLARGYAIKLQKNNQKNVVFITFLDIGQLLIATLVLSLPFLLTQGISFFLQTNYLIPLLIVLPLVFLIIIFSIKGAIKEKIVSIIKFLSRKKPRKSFLFKAIAFQFISWIIFSLATYILFRFSPTNHNILLILSAIVTSWLVGYLSVITPMGLGVREGAMALFLSNFLPAGYAVVIPVVSRLLIVMVELVNAILWLIYRRMKSSYN